MKSQKKLQVLLTADRATVAAGEPLGIKVSLKNAGTEPLVVMRPVDGCDMGWRVVAYHWIVTNEHGQPLKQKSLPRCGNTNALKTDDFIELCRAERRPWGRRIPFCCRWKRSTTCPGPALTK